MTLSLAEIDLAALRNPHLVLRAAAAGIGLNHLLFGAVVLGAGRLLAPDAETWAGIVLVAACPPGVGVVPFTVLLGGDLVLSTVAVAAGFLASLALAPALVALLADGAVLPPSAVARLIATLVVLPAILAAGIRGLGLRGRVRRLHGPVVNVGFAVILATLLGANRPHLFGRPEALVPSLAAAVAGVPLLAIAVRAALRRLGAAHAAGVSLLLLATVKNTFFAASVAYAVAGGPAAVPGVVASAVTISYLMLVERFLPVRAQAAAYTRPR